MSAAPAKGSTTERKTTSSASTDSQRPARMSSRRRAGTEEGGASFDIRGPRVAHSGSAVSCLRPAANSRPPGGSAPPLRPEQRLGAVQDDFQVGALDPVPGGLRQAGELFVEPAAEEEEHGAALR